MGTATAEADFYNSLPQAYKACSTLYMPEGPRVAAGKANCWTLILGNGSVPLTRCHELAGSCNVKMWNTTAIVAGARLRIRRRFAPHAARRRSGCLPASLK
jgi:hypothetical protein